MSTFVAATNNTATASTSVVLNVPGGTADNDVMIAIIATSANSLNTPAGWNNLGTHASGGASANAFWRIAASEPASYSFTVNVAANLIGTMLTYTGVTFPAPATYGLVQHSGTPGVSGTTLIISPPGFSEHQVPHSRYRIIFAPIQDSSQTFSALSGSMSSRSNNALTGITMLVGDEDWQRGTSTRFVGSRQVTTTGTTGNKGGWIIFLTDSVIDPAQDVAITTATIEQYFTSDLPLEEIVSGIQATARYTMRAFKTTPTTGHVYWQVTGQPDTTGDASGYTPGDLTDIVIVNKETIEVS